jgi:membrane-anchored mycosin MYCP
VLSAPAQGIVTAAPKSVYSSGYAEMDGTSAASAIVSGVAALVRAKHPEMPAKDVVNALIKTAQDLAEPGRDETTGFGMVNPMGALTAQFPPVERNPLLPSPKPSTPQPTPTLAAQRPVQPAAKISDRLPFVAAVAGGTAVLTGLLIALPAIRSRRSQRSAQPVVSARDTPPTPW